MVAVGHRIEKYEIFEQIGSGGMGVVYRARHVTLGAEVALKVLGSNFVANPNVRHRFQQEAYVQSQLSHPNIVSVTDFVDTEEVLAIVMPLISGPSLEEVLAAEEAGPWSPQDVWSLMEPVLEGVAYAHGRGIVHRDLKPGNIMLDGHQSGAVLGTPKVTDFGLAKILSTDVGVTRTGARMGTMGYMAPEQFGGQKEIGPATDVFALGILYWRVLTGGFYADPEDMFQMAGLCSGNIPIPTPRSQVASIPHAISAAVMSALELAPADRPADAGAWLAALKTAHKAPAEEAPEPNHAPPAPTPKSAPAEPQTPARPEPKVRQNKQTKAPADPKTGLQKLLPYLPIIVTLPFLVIGIVRYGQNKTSETTKADEAPYVTGETAEKAGPPAPAPWPDATKSLLNDAPRLGPHDSPIRVLFFGGFECPFSKRLIREWKRHPKENPDVAFQFIQSPFSFHNKSIPLAVGSLAAHRQGRFWEYAEQLFLTFRRAESAERTVKSLARQLGLDEDQFAKDFHSPDLNALALRSREACTTAISSSPNVIVNGSLFNPSSYNLKSALRTERDAVAKLIAAGYSPEEAYVIRVRSNFAGQKVRRRNNDPERFLEYFGFPRQTVPKNAARPAEAPKAPEATRPAEAPKAAKAPEAARPAEAPKAPEAARPAEAPKATKAKKKPRKKRKFKFNINSNGIK